MTMIEKKMQSLEKEIEKLAKSLDRYTALLEKKTAICDKLGCNWSDEEYDRRIKQLHARHEGESIVHFGNDDDLITAKQNGAWFDMSLAQDNVEDCRRRIQNAEKRYANAAAKVKEENERDEAFRKEYDRLSDMERKMLAEKAEKEYQKWLAWFKAECLKDGIIIKEASNSMAHGNTPSGKSFFFCINSGWTERSFHCYSLRIDGHTRFTSGEFWTCYSAVKRS